MDALSPAAVTTLIEATAAAFHAHFARLPGAALGSGPDWQAVSVPYAHAYLNGVWNARFTAERVEDGIEEALAFFRPRGVPFFWHVGASTMPANLGELLEGHGLHFHQEEAGMALYLPSLREDIVSPPGLTIQRVADAETLAVWAEVWAGEVMVGRQGMARELFGAMGLEPARPLQSYLGRLEGRPVATVALYAGPEAASVEHVVTVREARRQGIGTAMTLHAVRQARALGYRWVVLSGSPLGQPVYRRLGFQEYFRWKRWMGRPVQTAET